MRDVGGGARLLLGALLLLLGLAPAARWPPDCCRCLPVAEGVAACECGPGAVRRCGRERSVAIQLRIRALLLLLRETAPWLLKCKQAGRLGRQAG